MIAIVINYKDKKIGNKSLNLSLTREECTVSFSFLNGDRKRENRVTRRLRPRRKEKREYERREERKYDIEEKRKV